MGLDEIIAQQRLILEKQTVNPNRDSPLADLEALKSLSLLARQVADAVEKGDTADAQLDAVTATIASHTNAYLTHYTAAERITDEQYAALSAKQKESTIIEHLADHLSTIDHNTQRMIAALKRERAHKPYFKRLTKLKSRFDHDKNLGDIDSRQTLVREQVIGAIENVRAEYAKERTTLKEGAEQFQANAHSVFEAADHLLLEHLATHDLGGEYTALQQRISSAKRVSSQEREQIRALIVPTVLELKHQMPAIASATHYSLQGMIAAELEQYGKLLTYSPQHGIEVHDEPRVQRRNIMRTALNHLESAALDELTQKNMPKTPVSVTTPLAHLESQLEFFRRERGSLEVLIGAIIGAPVTKTERFELIARTYGIDTKGIYGAPSWRSQRNLSGAYALAERVRIELIDAVKAQVLQAAKEQGESLQTLALAEGTTDKGLLERSAELQRFVTHISAFLKAYAKIDTNKRGAETLYEIVGKSEEFATLRDALEQPGEILGVRDRLRTATRADLVARDYQALFDIYQRVRERIDETFAAASDTTRNHPVTKQLFENATGRLRERLAARAVALSQGERVTATQAPAQAEALERIIAETAGSSSTTQGLFTEELEKLKQQGTSAYAKKSILQRVMGVFTNTEPKAKLYVLDTNVLMSDPDALKGFGEENYIILPREVLAELDKLKTSPRGDVAFDAREVHRRLQELTLDTSERLSPGVTLGGRIIDYDQLAELRHEAVSNIAGNPAEQRLNELVRMTYDHPDAMIVRAAQRFAQREAPRWKNSPVIFVSKDINARKTATSEGLEAQDYQKEAITQSPERMYTGWRYITAPSLAIDDAERHGLTRQLLDHIMDRALDPEAILDPRPSDEKRKIIPLLENEFVIVRDPERYEQTLVLRYRGGALEPLRFVPEEARVFPLQHFLHAKDSERTYAGMNPRSAKQLAAVELMMDPEVETVSIAGNAGTGKTYLVARVSGELLQRQHKWFGQSPYEMVYYTAPNVQVEKDMGFLPGSADEKQAPYVAGFAGHVAHMIKEGRKISYEIHPLTFMRGRDIKNAIRVLDEAQNTTPHAMKAFITRHSENAKTIVMGDPGQVDDPKLNDSNGFAHLRLGFLGQDNYGHITFQKSERSRVAEQGELLLPYRGRGRSR